MASKWQSRSNLMQPGCRHYYCLLHSLASGKYRHDYHQNGMQLTKPTIRKRKKKQSLSTKELHWEPHKIEKEIKYICFIN